MTTCRDAVLAAVSALTTRSGGEPVSVAEIVAEVARGGSRHAESTVRTHIAAHMCVNAAKPPQWPDLRRVGRGLYVPVESPLVPVVESGGAGLAQTPFPPAEGRSWPWEGAVQAVFAEHLVENGWVITGMADTATKQQGVDLLAAKNERRLGAEVKGWPSTGYSDPRRAGEVKPTQPTNQAGHWFSQAVVKGLMLLDSHPGLESLVVVPDYPRYRDLGARTRTGRTRANVHVVFVAESGKAESATWQP